jgi:hypothetical protein
MPTFADVKVYAKPSSWRSLRGRRSGLVTVDPNIEPLPGRQFDLGDPVDVAGLYAAVVRDGWPAQQEALLDAVTLKALWPDLLIPARCREEWEETFPELQQG